MFFPMVALGASRVVQAVLLGLLWGMPITWSSQVSECFFVKIAAKGMNIHVREYVSGFSPH